MTLTFKRGLMLVTAGYAVSRMVFYLLGIRFLGLDNLHVYLQFIDPPLLQHDLLRSLFYSSFPPLYNLIVGVMLKLFGESAVAFAVLHLFTGWAIGLVLFALLADLGVGLGCAVLATLLYLVLPPMVLYENWLFYSYLETLLFLLLIWSFHRFISRYSLGWGLVLFSSCTALALLNARMMVLAIIIGGLLGWHWRMEIRQPQRLRLVTRAASPLLLVVLVMAKNACLFGEFTVDPHFGFHMGNGFVYFAWTDPEAHDVCQRDYPILLMAPANFPPADKAGLNVPEPTGVPLLDEPLRSHGKPNYNSLFYLEVSQLYAENLSAFVREHPRLYVKFVGVAFKNYWQAADNYVFFPDTNLKILGQYDAIYRYLYPLLGWLYGLAALYSLWLVWSRCIPAGSTLLFALAVIGYNLLAVLVTLGENDRYKFTIEPLLWVLLIYALSQAWGSLQRWRKTQKSLAAG